MIYCIRIPSRASCKKRTAMTSGPAFVCEFKGSLDGSSDIPGVQGGGQMGVCSFNGPTQRTSDPGQYCCMSVACERKSMYIEYTPPGYSVSNAHVLCRLSSRLHKIQANARQQRSNSNNGWGDSTMSRILWETHRFPRHIGISCCSHNDCCITPSGAGVSDKRHN